MEEISVNQAKQYFLYSLKVAQEEDEKLFSRQQVKKRLKDEVEILQKIYNELTGG